MKVVDVRRQARYLDSDLQEYWSLTIDGTRRSQAASLPTWSRSWPPISISTLNRKRQLPEEPKRRWKWQCRRRWSVTESNSEMGVNPCISRRKRFVICFKKSRLDRDSIHSRNTILSSRLTSDQCCGRRYLTKKTKAGASLPHMCSRTIRCSMRYSKSAEDNPRLSNSEKHSTAWSSRSYTTRWRSKRKRSRRG